MYKLTEHKDEIITHIIKNLIWIPIATIIPIVYSLLQTLYSVIIKYGSLDIFVTIISVISIFISLVSVVCVVRKTRNTSPTPLDNDSPTTVSPVTDFRIKTVEIELLFKDRVNITSSTYYELIANVDGLDRFEKQMIWTGKDYYGTKLVEKDGNYELKMYDSNDSMHKYRVNFVDSLNCGDIARFKLETEVADTSYSMDPISSYMVKHQTDELILRIVVPRNLIRNVRQSIYHDLSRQMKIGASQIIRRRCIGQNDCYEINVQNPTISHRYFIEWEFTKQD